MKIKRIEHIAIAVDDMEEVSAILEQKLGLALDHAEYMPQYQTRLAMFPIGDTCLELLAGTGPEAGVSKWIAQRGQSIYHICLEVDDIDAALVELREKGVSLVNDKPIIGHAGWRVAFIDPASTANILFELAEAPANDFVSSH